MHIMQKLCRNYAKKIMQKLCRNYAEIMQKLCNFPGWHNYACIMQKLCKLCKNYANYASLQKLCKLCIPHFADVGPLNQTRSLAVQLSGPGGLRLTLPGPVSQSCSPAEAARLGGVLL